ncbi:MULTISPECIES: Hsp20/alpha crystallin family protein [Aneurinibacillus]|uniref:HSP20 family protein n=1 Tax=Aneurinibacillus thermoaerophilus TaxID=143495 RepID=A0A1G8D5S3_ANETH|nr:MULTISPECIES: Hsp20/alpha crystallin family protein [Aneurinibacillus]AMA74289.1 heat-shock protein Hsp20 [Aneurinibacillus sp. XH2]MED0675773.1 Hsp20/alpha crystallin family protein [Aneurinibacillus thermoaerophilus]MED0680684.1 Hsp20/alpha crystallin family protein [Aneurinibacillus thermoaerophilus]MED0736815.1 Hsp20/alpha crystallin family protein [Aneurinibacillus thermoaerophilus]MED0758909.1 Hsp20/alpha crystallin family protein [Aneurinibacillus thermoaerophilus]
MALIPYEPFRHLENLRRELDQFFATGFPADKDFGVPRIDIHETENEIVASCDIPGLERKEDINIDVENNVLSISGSVNRVHETKEEQMHRQERFIGRFHRLVTLPARVSAEGVKATYRNGVLEIRMPKVKQHNNKRIDVEFH